MKVSQFATHLNADSGILRLMDDLGTATTAKEPVYMLGGGDPAMIPPMQQLFRQQMMRLLDTGQEFEQMIGNYDAPQGNLRFIRTLAELLRARYGWPITPEHIAVTNGSQSSFGLLFNLFSGEFDDRTRKKILLPLIPEYIGYAEAALGTRSIFTAQKPLITEFREQGINFYKYVVDFSNLCLDNIGALCISRPTNPTGNVITDEELQQLARLAREADVPLIVDNAYGLPFPGMIFTAAKPYWDSNIVLCLSLSKLGLPGARTGIIVANPDLITLIKRANAILNLAPGRFGPTLVTSMLEDGSLLDACQQWITPYYRNKSRDAVKLVSEHLRDLPYCIHYPEGSMFLWLWFKDFPMDTEMFYQRLKDRGVRVIAGQHFFIGLEQPWDHSHQCIRISYSGAAQHVQQGIAIIGELARQIYRSA